MSQNNVKKLRGSQQNAVFYTSEWCLKACFQKDVSKRFGWGNKRLEKQVVLKRNSSRDILKVTARQQVSNMIRYLKSNLEKQSCSEGKVGNLVDQQKRPLTNCVTISE